jgi:hypothetical protein
MSKAMDDERRAFEKWFTPLVHNQQALRVLGLRGIMHSAFQMGWKARAALQPAYASSEAIVLLKEYLEMCKFNAEVNEYGAAEGWKKDVARIEDVIAALQPAVDVEKTFETFKQEKIPKAGAVIHAIAEEAFNAGLNATKRVDVEGLAKEMEARLKPATGNAMLMAKNSGIDECIAILRAHAKDYAAAKP